MTAQNVAGTNAAAGGGGARLTGGTLWSAAYAVLVAQLALAIPAVLQGKFQADLVPSSSQLTWISDAFLVPVTLLELTFGVLGDLFGRKRLLIIGAALLAVGELVAILVPGTSSSTNTRVAVLWTGMALAGAGAAAIMPTSLAMVAAGTHTPADRARAVAIWAGALSAGNMLSPVLGGWLAGFSWGSDANASWRYGALLILVLAVISMGVSFLARNSASPEGRSLDWLGQVTVAIALFALMFAVIQGPSAGWGSTEVISAFVAAVVFLIAFIWAENRHPAPLLDLKLFRIRPFAVASIGTVIGMFAFLGTAYSTSIRLTVVLGYTPLHAAIAFILFNGTALPLIPLTTRLLHAYNPKWTMGVGLVLIAIGDFWTFTVSVATQVGLGALIVPYLLVGIGFAFAVSAMTAVLVDAVPIHLEGMASAAANMLRDFGFTLGPALVGAITISQASARIHSAVASSASLSKALSAFDASGPKALVGAVNSGPLAATSIPDPPNPIHQVAFLAMGHANGTGYLVCSIAALIAALLVMFAIGGGARDTLIAEESLVSEAETA